MDVEKSFLRLIRDKMAQVNTAKREKIMAAAETASESDVEFKQVPIVSGPSSSLEQYLFENGLCLRRAITMKELQEQYPARDLTVSVSGTDGGA